MGGEVGQWQNVGGLDAPTAGGDHETGPTFRGDQRRDESSARRYLAQEVAVAEALGHEPGMAGLQLRENRVESGVGVLEWSQPGVRLVTGADEVGDALLEAVDRREG